jgi:AraC-like DNA-binding protein
MPEFVLRSVGQTYSHGHVLEPHSHRWGQLIYAVTGTMQVLAADTLWLVPPTRALWAPAGIVHAIVMRGSTAMRTIYVPPDQGNLLPAKCHAIEVSSLLRELILHIVGLRLLRAGVSTHEHLAELFLDLVAAAPGLPLFVPMPQDERAASVARVLRDDPARDDDIEHLARLAGASVRTLQRIFRKETGMRFVEWRQRLRLMQALERLEQGASVTAAGAEAGYASTSAFIAAFRAQVGETPKRFRRSIPLERASP